MTSRTPHESEASQGKSEASQGNSFQSDEDEELMVSFPKGPRARTQSFIRMDEETSSPPSSAPSGESSNESSDDESGTSSSGGSSSSSDSKPALVEMHPLNFRDDAKSSISCSSTSDETSARLDSSTVLSEKKKRTRIQKVSEEPSYSSSSGQNSSSASGPVSNSSSKVSTSGGIPYPKAAKKSVVYYGWGDIPPSESNFSQENSQYESSHDGSTRSNRVLFAEFPNRQRCDASLTESQATSHVVGMQLEEVGASDEYDPKRPWKQKPMDLLFSEEEKTSEKSFAVSALSGSDAGTVFLDTRSAGVDGNNSDSGKKSIPVGSNENGAQEGGAHKSPARSDEGKSVRSARSSLNSDISELNVAKAALQKSSVELSNVERKVYVRGLSERSVSDFTLTSQPFRKPEPFRPGPGSSTSQIPHVNSSATLNTLENIYEETGQNLLIPLPPNPPPRQRNIKALSFYSGGSIPSLPSIIENPNRSTIQQDGFKQTSDITMDDSDARVGNEVTTRTGTSRRISELTAMDMDEENSFRTRVSELKKQHSIDEPSHSSGSISTTDRIEILRATEKMSNAHHSRLLAALGKTDGEDTQDYSKDRSDSVDRQEINTFDSEKFGLEDSARDFHTFTGAGEHSIAESSDDEDERVPMRMSSRQSSRGDIASNVNYRCYKCTHCCRRCKPRCCRCCGQHRKALAAGFLAIILIAASVYLIFFRGKEAKVPPGRKEDGGPPRQAPLQPQPFSQAPTLTMAPTSTSLPTTSPTFTLMPSVSPTQVATLWPTPLDTYTEKYPPPPPPSDNAPSSQPSDNDSSSLS